MPTTRTKRTRNRIIGAGGITEADYLYFCFGEYFEAEHYERGKTKAELRAFWKKHRKAIMERYLDEDKCIGRRPWAFWKWDMPEPQRPTPPGEFEAQKVWDRQRGIYDWVETDFAYLKRLNLLTAWEIEVEKKKEGK